MNYDNKYIHDPCGLVEEPDLKEATKIGLEMLAFAKKNKLLSVAANQVGYDKQVLVIRDNDGYDVYFNPEISPAEVGDGMFSVSQEKHDFPAILPSFPRNRFMVEVADKIEVDVFSVANDDRITFNTEGGLAHIWQIMAEVLGGVDMDSIVPCDFQTIRGKEKKKPNAKCSGCGKKNKKCSCP